MKKVDLEIEKILNKRKLELEHLREEFDWADSNNVHHQNRIQQAISELVKEIEGLEALLKK
jgi:hypothetical protein